ncbi:MAG: protein kinase domain-containing protein [Gemmatimonadaceae bacterium]
MADQVTKIGKYQIIEQVGEGAMGVVYRAIDPVLNRPVAVKIMNEGLAQDEALRQRFLREAQAAGSLQHPNVVTIYDFGETDGHLFIAMEFIDGTDLEKLLARDSAIPLAAKLDIIIDVLNGLAYAHRRGIVHRDIKPANIRIDSEGHARIMDFGVAHLATSNLTGTGVMMGTPNYMAPEQITSGDVTAGTDIFSVGAVLYELLTNDKPFAADTLHRVLFRIVSDPPPDLLKTDPDLPPALDSVIKKALAKDVAQRYASATEMANDVSAVRSSLGAPRASRTVSQRSSIEKALLAQRQLQQGRDVRRWQMISAAAALLFVVGGGSAVFLALKSASARRPEAPPTASAPQTRANSAAARDTVTPAPVQPAVVVAGAPQDSVDSPPAAPRRVERPTAQAPRRQVPPPEPLDSAALRTQVAPRDTAPTPPTPPTSPVPQPLQSQSQTALPAGPLPAVGAPLSSGRPDSAPPRVTTPRESPRVAVTNIVSAYARAIASRNVAELRRIYAGMTAAQQSAWESFFGSVRSMTASLDIATFEAGDTTAVARVTGVYEFVTRAGRSERQPASFEATFAREGERWRMQTVR